MLSAARLLLPSGVRGVHHSPPVGFATIIPEAEKDTGNQGTPSDQAGNTAEKQALAAAQEGNKDLHPEVIKGKDGIQPPEPEKTEKAEKVEGEDEPSGGHHGS